jgi:hypothetical protein
MPWACAVQAVWPFIDPATYKKVVFINKKSPAGERLLLFIKSTQSVSTAKLSLLVKRPMTFATQCCWDLVLWSPCLLAPAVPQGVSNEDLRRKQILARGPPALR